MFMTLMHASYNTNMCVTGSKDLQAIPSGLGKIIKICINNNSIILIRLFRKPMLPQASWKKISTLLTPKRRYCLLKTVLNTAGVHIFHLPPRPPPPGMGEGAKIWVIGWLGKKYDDLLRKNANIRGKRWKNGKKWKIFTGKKYHFGKRGQKYHILVKIYTLAIQPCRRYRLFVFKSKLFPITQSWLEK